MSDLIMIVMGVILTAGTFIFVAAEFSLVALDQAVVERRAVEGDKRQHRFLKLPRRCLRSFLVRRSALH